MARELDERDGYPRDIYCAHAAQLGVVFYKQPLRNALTEVRWMGELKGGDTPFGAFGTKLNTSVDYERLSTTIPLDWLPGGADGILRVAFSIGQPTLWDEVNKRVPANIVEQANETFPSDERGRRKSFAMNMHTAEREFFSSATAFFLLYAAYGARVNHFVTEKGREHILGKLMRPLSNRFFEPAESVDDFMQRVTNLFELNDETGNTHAYDIIHESRAFVNSSNADISIGGIPGVVIHYSAAARHVHSQQTTEHPGVCPGQDMAGVVYQAMGELIANDERYRSLIKRLVTAV